MYIAVIAMLISAGIPSQGEANAIGLRFSGDSGSPAVQWERHVTDPVALTFAIGQNRRYAGMHLQAGVKYYSRPEHSGRFVHLTATAGRGGTEFASWSMAQLGAVAGYSWAFRPQWRGMIELGYGIRRVTAADVFDNRVSSQSHHYIFGFTLLWRR